MDAEEVVPKDCPFCDEGEGFVEFEHTPSGVAVWCAGCNAHGPCVEGMSNAARIWNGISATVKV